MDRLTTDPKQGDRSKRGGFTLVELLVVIAIIAALAGMITAAVQRARSSNNKVICANNLSNIGKAAQMYSDANSNRYPWPKPLRGGSGGTLSDDADARAALELLYKYNFVDDPKVYKCPAAAVDEPAEGIEDLKERRETFHLDDFQCSYTWRNKFTAVNDSSTTPLSGDKRGGETSPTNHKDGRNVLYKGGQVEFFDLEKLEGQGKDSRKLARELIGFGTLD